MIVGVAVPSTLGRGGAAAPVFDLAGHTFFGTDDEFVLVVAGIHSSEQGGVEVAHWVRTKLAGRRTPTRLGAVVVPEIFPAQGQLARAREWEVGPHRWNAAESGKFRDPVANRHFPPPGRPLSFLTGEHLKTLTGADLLDHQSRPIPLLAEVKRLIQLIETLRPVRIVSIHGKKRRTERHLRMAAEQGAVAMSEGALSQWQGEAVKGVNFAGIFVDPRYTVSRGDDAFLEDAKFDRAADPAFPAITPPGVGKVFNSAHGVEGREDDALCLAMASAVAHPALVAGNHLGTDAPVVHYVKERGVPQGFSLGDWAPVAVEGSRPAAPVFTVEVDENHQSWAFLDGVGYMDEAGNPVPQPKRRPARLTPAQFDGERSAQLQDYAQAIIEHALA